MRTKRSSLLGPLLIRVAGLAIVLVALTHCDESRPSQDEIESDDVRLADASFDSETSVWESAPLYDGMREDYAWIDYGGQAELTIHHPLGRPPKAVLVYIAFRPQGQGSVLAAGDLARIERVSAESVTVRNATNEDFYLRLVVF